MGSGTFDGYLCIERKIGLTRKSSDEASKAAIYIVGTMGIEELSI